MAARLSALRASRTLPPGFFIFKESWYSFLLVAENSITSSKVTALSIFANFHAILRKFVTSYITAHEKHVKNGTMSLKIFPPYNFSL
jgi:hypothetical protein